MKPIAIIGDFNPSSETHVATNDALTHVASQLSLKLDSLWLPPRELDPSNCAQYSGVWVTTGAPEREMEVFLSFIAEARRQQLPILGTCGGFQRLTLELARNVMGLEDAAHEEVAPDAECLFITKFSCSLRGHTLPITLARDSLVARLYKRNTVEEKYYCSYGLNTTYEPLLKEHGILVTGWDDEKQPRVLELANYPFFLATLFVPQTNSTMELPHPIIMEFAKECLTMD